MGFGLWLVRHMVHTSLHRESNLVNGKNQRCLLF